VAWAVDANGWRWAFYEMLMLSGAAVVFLSVVMPEASLALDVCNCKADWTRQTPKLSCTAVLRVSAVSPVTRISDPRVRSSSLTCTLAKYCARLCSGRSS
jgi:hypothetical protein